MSHKRKMIKKQYCISWGDAFCDFWTLNSYNLWTVNSNNTIPSVFVQCDVMSTKLDFPIPSLLSSLLPGDSISRLLEPQGRGVFLRSQEFYTLSIQQLYCADKTFVWVGLRANDGWYKKEKKCSPWLIF